MAEKRVSVRLAAVGGKQVKAEMTGIGDAGAAGFQKISKEAAAANAKLAAFARRAGIAAAAMATAMAAAGVAMVRSGLQTVDAQAKLAQSLGTTVASIQTLERAGELAGVSMSGIEQATKDLTRRLSQAAAGTGPAAAALDRLGLSAKELIAMPLDKRVSAINAAIESFVPAAERAAVAGQLFGEEGSIAMSRIDTATLRQATEDVLAFGVVVSEQDADQIERTNDAISRLGLVWRGLANQLTVAVAPSLEAVANALAAATRVGGVFQTTIEFLGRNLGEIASIAGALATFFAGRFVLAMGAAALGLKGVTAGLVTLKTAIVRTGVGVLIVGLGELAYRMDIFGDAADESAAAQARMNEALGLYAQVGGPTARAEAIASTQAYIGEAAAKLESAEASLALIRAEQESRQGVLDRLGDRPDIPGLGAMAAAELQAAIDRAAQLQAELTAARTRLREIEESDPAAPLAAALGPAATLSGALAGAATQATRLTAALGKAPEALASLQDQAAVISAGLNAAAMGYDRLGVSEAQYRAGLEREYGLAQLTHYEQRQLVQEQIDARVALFAANQERQGALDAYLAKLGEVPAAEAAAGGAGAAAAEQTATGWAAVTQTLSEYAASAANWGKGLGETLSRAFQSAESAVRSFAMTGKLDFKGLVQSMLADLAVLSFRSAVLGPLAKWLGGALGGVGSTLGNLGGTAAVMHDGGIVGGASSSRWAPALAFAGAPRMHAGGWAGLAPDEVPAILQRGERVLSRREAMSPQGGASTLDLRVYVDRDGNWQAAVERISGTIVANVVPSIVKQSVKAVGQANRASRTFAMGI